MATLQNDTPGYSTDWRKPKQNKSDDGPAVSIERFHAATAISSSPQNKSSNIDELYYDSSGDIDESPPRNSPYSMLDVDEGNNTFRKDEIALEKLEKLAKRYFQLSELEREKVEELIRIFAKGTVGSATTGESESRTWEETITRIQDFFADSDPYYERLGNNGIDPDEIKRQQLKLLIARDIQDIDSS